MQHPAVTTASRAVRWWYHLTARSHSRTTSVRNRLQHGAPHSASFSTLSKTTAETADDATHVIIGAGSAGSVLANRLSENPENKVVLLEAGGRDDYIWIHVPMGYLFTMNNPRTCWCFQTVPQRGLNNRIIQYPRGRVIGGCSSINGMVYQRGNKGDYDHWGKDNPGWDWDNVLPVFKRAMDYAPGIDGAAAADKCGVGGRWRVERQRASWKVLDEVIKGAEERGIPFQEHFIDSQSEGIGYFNVNQKRGLRLSSFRAYLDSKTLRRPNLHVITKAFTKRLIVQDKRVIGVEFWKGDKNGTVHTVSASQDTVLCAGAVGSPHLLQVSGIGDGAMLERHRVNVVHSLPGVGRNLHDHLQIRPVFRLKEGTKTLNKLANTWSGKAMMGLQYLLDRSGPLSTAPSQLGVFAKSSPDKDYPDLQYHMQPLSLDRFGEPLHGFPGLTMSVCNLQPTSRGTVQLAGPDIRDAPTIDPAYLTTDEDRWTAVKAIRHARSIASAHALEHLTPSEHSPGPELQSDDEIADSVGSISTSIFHPVGTCKMGPASDSTAVVDSHLRVHGINGLRVADASIMPRITSGNTASPTMMIADKVADIMLSGG